ncbi:carboxypeptidase regulatory-like domain-containing protein [Gimesia sp.]|uniref:carboxypeptidase regulatory-like domain-containing protein n=1 Tax=Gimesia sp. TaxID=2024833 RepID=UPI003A9386C1
MMKSIIYFLAMGALLLTGCGSGAEKLPELSDATGTILLDGKPLAGAQVSFEPQITNSVKAKASFGSTDEQGKFKLRYNATTDGVIPGKQIVRVSKLSGTNEEPGEEILPDKYNTQSTLTAEVTKEGPNDFTFDLKSK